MLLQYLIVGLVVLASALVTLRKLAPQLTSRWLASASIALNNRRRSRWVRAIGRGLQPRQVGGDCSDGCSTCNACGPKRPTAAGPDVMPLKFRHRS